MYRRIVIVWLSLVFAVLPGLASAGQDTPLTEYLSVIAEMNRPYFIADPNQMNAAPAHTTASAYLEASRTAYTERLDTLRALTPPAEVEAVHQRYVITLESAVATVEQALADVHPTDAEEAAPAYMYRTPEFGYAFDDENAAICELKRVATEVSITDFPSLLCDRNIPMEMGEPVTVGSPDDPVNQIDILHDVACGGLCPKVTYAVNTIYARAGEPIQITFDNRNPLPFLFNLAIYRGYNPDERVRAEDLIVSTYAGGPRVHRVTVVLEPGEYSYVDNVHPGLMVGRLVVVE